jgi:hypothetical protein
MRCLIVIIVLSITNYHAAAQAGTNNLKSKDYYLQKSKSQKTTAWIFIGAGAAAVIAGTIVAATLEEEDNFDEGINKLATGGYLMAAGGVSCLISIPFFVSSGKNKRRALALSSGFQQIPMPANGTTIKQPAINIRITLGR